MSILKKIITISVLVSLIIQSPLHENNYKLTNIRAININHALNVSVLINSFNIKFLALVTEDMKKIEQKNPGTVEYTFYDGKGNQALQDNQLNDILTKKKLIL